MSAKTKPKPVCCSSSPAIATSAAQLLITANQPFGERGTVFPDQAMTLAAIDRLVHHATINSFSATTDSAASIV